MVGIQLQMINPTFFFLYLKGRCHGSRLKSKNWRFLRTNLLCCTAIRKGLQYRNSYFKRLDRMNISTSCTISVTFAPFVAIRQKSANHAIYLSCPGPTLTYFTDLVGVLVGMIFQIFVWRSPRRRCYGNQLNMGDVRKRRMEQIYSLLRHSTTNWPIINLLSKDSMAINRLHLFQIWSTSVQ